MTPIIKPLAVLGGTLLVLLLGKKAEAAVPPAPPEPLPPQPPQPPTPVPVPPIPPGSETSFPAGTILGVIASNGVRLRGAPSTSGAILGTLNRGTLVQLFEDGHAPPTAGAPQGWERVRTAGGIEGFVAAQFLTAQGLPGVPRETQGPDIPPAPGPGPLPGGVEPIPQTPETQGTTTETTGPLNVPITILTPEERAALGQLGDLFQGAPPRFGFFSPSIGARSPAYGQTMFVRPRQARFSGLPSRLYQQALYLRRVRAAGLRRMRG